MIITVKRVYESPSPGDGFRVLVDRLWPRGLSKEKARLDLWLKAIAPSNELRTWFNHQADKWPEFQARYFRELQANPEAVHQLLAATQNTSHLTLLYGAKNTQYNQAIALKTYLETHS